MTVYIDDMHRSAMGRHRRMKMCHMVADSDEELHLMADAIGVARRWWQAPPLHSSHYDIALVSRAKAVERGAVQITVKQCAAMVARRRVTGELGQPQEALAWLKAYRAQQKEKGPEKGP